MNSVINAGSALAVQGLLALVHAAEPIVDVTYGSGVFWRGYSGKVFGGDLDPARAQSWVGSFLALPFADASLPTVVYDPPFHTNHHGRRSLFKTKFRFSTLGENVQELKPLYQQGLREAWRVTARHLLVKCQDYIHNHTPQWMTLWTCEVCGEPFEWLTVTGTQGKWISSRWVTVRSLRRNHATYLLFDKHGNKR